MREGPAPYGVGDEPTSSSHISESRVQSQPLLSVPHITGVEGVPESFRRQSRRSVHRRDGLGRGE